MSALMCLIPAFQPIYASFKVLFFTINSFVGKAIITVNMIKVLRFAGKHS